MAIFDFPYPAAIKQKRGPKLKDKKQSERFKEAARELGADESSEAFARIVGEMARSKETAFSDPKAASEYGRKGGLAKNKQK